MSSDLDPIIVCDPDRLPSEVALERDSSLSIRRNFPDRGPIRSLEVEVITTNDRVCIDTISFLYLGGDVRQNYDTVFCRGDEFSIFSPFNLSGSWSDGTDSNVLAIRNEGQYTFTPSVGCFNTSFTYDVEEIDCKCIPIVPNALSPNFDGVNDDIQIFFSCDVPTSVRSILLYDRWGNLVLEADGSYLDTMDATRLNDLDGGVYVLSIQYISNDQVQNFACDVTLIR